MTESTNVTTIPANSPRPGMRYFGVIAPANPATGAPEQRDAVTIERIKQYQGITDVISALHHIPQGEVWSIEEIAKRKIEIEYNDTIAEPNRLLHADQSERDTWYMREYRRLQKEGHRTGLTWDTVESLPFSEAIKSCDVENPADVALRDQHIANYKQSLENLGKFGITRVIGNFMPVADWTRTGYHIDTQGRRALEYNHAAFTAFDVYILKRHDTPQGYIADKSYTAEELEAAKQYWEAELENNVHKRVELSKMIVAGLPGCQGIKSAQTFGDSEEDKRKEEQWIADNLLPEYRAQVGKYKGWDKKRLQDNIAVFLEAVVPVAQAHHIRLCSHPDDPAFSPFMGTPRSVGLQEDYKFLIDHGCGVNLCTGSLMANPQNRENIYQLILNLAEYGKSRGMSIDEIFPHVHLRPIETDGKNFREGTHTAHIEELKKIIATLSYLDWHGVYRPDHALTPTYEKDADGRSKPVGDRGYHGAGRAEGAALLMGLFEGLQNQFDRDAVRAHLQKTGAPSDDTAVENSMRAHLDEYLAQPPKMRVPMATQIELERRASAAARHR